MSIRLSYFMLSLLLAASATNAQTSSQTNVTAKAGNAPAVAAPVETDRSRDGLTGPVRRVRTEIAKLSTADGKLAESKHVLVEIVAYDIKGNKIENQYFPIAGATLTGKEVYKYDEKGNISEMTLLNPDGTLLSKEIYKYEFDFAGNWNRMITSVAVVDGRGITFEPTEVTYRSIMYYLDENMMKAVQPGAPATTPNASATNNAPAPQPVAPAPANNAANNAAKTTPVDPKANANKARNNTKQATVPDLPSASATATRLSGAPLDVKSPAVASNQAVPVINLDSEPPPTPGPRPILKPVSGGVLNGTALSLPPPAYPDAAKRSRTAGVVTVDVILDETGKVVSATASSGPMMLRDAAVQAALKARFSPTKLSGQPVKVSGVINYKFALVN
ncbi:MAG TPA: TonB family protein [Pyrinomonadaceae bacterium]|nr:TonB family protein [Pyrinomonadaceae bacterium]